MKSKFSLFFLMITAFVLKGYSHPYFVSVTEVHINTEKKTFDISCSMFTEDLESAIKSIYITKTDLQKELGAKEVLDLIEKYIQARLQISIGGEKQAYILTGCENQEESTWCYLEGSISSLNKTVAVSNSLLFDFLEEQTNMVHVYWNEERQSTKLNNPHKFVEFSF
jgi:hypothetical protein